MATFLVTGSTGQLGSATVRLLGRQGHRVIALTSSESGARHTDIDTILWPRDRSMVPPALPASVDVVLHLGAQTSAYVARDDPARDVTDNVTRFVALLAGLRRQRSVPLVVLAGAVTDVGASQPVVLDGLPYRPETFYDVAKVAQGLYLRQFELEGAVRGVNLRFSNIYGGSLSGSSSHRGFINRAVAAALAGGDIHLYRGIEGRRDFLQVDDAARAILSVCNASQSLTRSDYVVGSGQSLRLRDALQLVAEIVNLHTGGGSRVREIEPPDGLYAIELRDAQVHSVTFRADAGWSPEIDFASGIALMITDR
jgi:nucleoside-diphosphate-sugar epimerase